MKRLFKNQKTNAVWEARSLHEKADMIELDAKTGCFFMVDHLSDKSLIKELSARLLRMGCRSFYFWGKYRDLWHLWFDETYVQMQDDLESEAIAVTADCSTWEDLVEEILFEIPLCDFNLNRFVIFYDDENDYSALCRDCEAQARIDEK